MTIIDDQAELLRLIERAWSRHPDWSLGRLICSAASIKTGAIGQNPRNLTDKELIGGLRALHPDSDEAGLKGPRRKRKPKISLAPPTFGPDGDAA